MPKTLVGQNFEISLANFFQARSHWQRLPWRQKERKGWRWNKKQLFCHFLSLGIRKRRKKHPRSGAVAAFCGFKVGSDSLSNFLPKSVEKITNQSSRKTFLFKLLAIFVSLILCLHSSSCESPWPETCVESIEKVRSEPWNAQDG